MAMGAAAGDARLRPASACWTRAAELREVMILRGHDSDERLSMGDLSRGSGWGRCVAQPLHDVRIHSIVVYMIQYNRDIINIVYELL